MMSRPLTLLVASAAIVLLAAGQASSQGPTLPLPTFPAVVAGMNEPRAALAELDRKLAAAGESQPIEGLVLRSHLLAGAGRRGEAAASWDEVSRRYPDLGEFAQRSAIAALIADRNPDAALVRVRSLAARASDDLLISVADGYKDAGRPQDAAPLFREVLARQRRSQLADRARTGLAACLESMRDLESALSTWRQAALNWQMPATFTAAREAERRVSVKLRREPPSFAPDDYLSVAARLTSASHFDTAVALLEEAKKAGALSGERVDAAIVDGLYRGRRNDEALKRASECVARYPASRQVPDMRLVQLRILIRQGDVAHARRSLAALHSDRAVPLATRQSAARLVAAQLVATGAAREGLAMYRGMLQSRMPRGDRYDLSWRAGIAAMRAGDNATASSMLRQARRAAPPRSTPRSTLYWLGVASGLAGDRPGAIALWQQLVAENSYDYYGLRAADRLKTLAVRVVTGPRVSFDAPDVGEVAQSSSEFRTAMVLARAGLVDPAASLLRTLSQRLRNDSGLALLAARAAYAAEDYYSAWSLTSTRFALFLAQPAANLPQDIWQMAFPRAYWSEVEPAARRAGVDPLLLLSLMRRESRFISSARSRSGALGLFQIMPYTARELAEADEPQPAEQLLAAPASTDLAARLVRRIMSRLGDAPAPIVASYNAGEDRVESWWRAAAGLPEDLFVDSIPYGETRQYVREVLANYAAYKRLYAGG